LSPGKKAKPNQSREQASQLFVDTVQKNSKWITAELKPNTTQLDVGVIKTFVKRVVSDNCKAFFGALQIALDDSEDAELDLDLIKATILSNLEIQLNIKNVCYITKSEFQGAGEPHQQRKAA